MTTSPTTTLRSEIERLIPEVARGFGLRERILKVLSSCPAAGNGVHNWLYVAALKLHRHVPDKDLLEQFISTAVADCGREVTDEEIHNAVINSQQAAEGTPLRTVRPRWPKPDVEIIAAITKTGPDLAGLKAMSPVQLTEDRPHTEELMDAMFPGNPLICAAAEKERSLTRPREEWRGSLEHQQFIVPSPMTAVLGKTKNGRDSMRSLANTGPRRFIVVEFDQGSFDDHSAILIDIGQYAPLVMAVHSGNKSLHGWYFCEGQPKEKVERFFRYAVSLGADPATWTRCQLVRMFGGRRDNGKRQSVVFFNPESLKGK